MNDSSSDNKKFYKISILDLIDPQKDGPLEVYRNYWWAVDDYDNAFVFHYFGNDYPQGNKDKGVMEMLIKLEAIPGATHAKLLPWAYLQIHRAGEKT